MEQMTRATALGTLNQVHRLPRGYKLPSATGTVVTETNDAQGGLGICAPKFMCQNLITM
jgi:hypothetical protein